MPWVKAWYHYAASHFLVAYEETVGAASLVPRNPESANILLEAFLLNKAVYELGYELNNRPDWTIIPLKGILYVLQEESTVTSHT
jgi:maltose alpha-D-glucosyltransferase/alpha-amylase